jgi:hypothetical protein
MTLSQLQLVLGVILAAQCQTMKAALLVLVDLLQWMELLPSTKCCHERLRRRIGLLCRGRRNQVVVRM